MAVDENFDTHADALQSIGVMVLAAPIDTDSVKPIIEWILYENLVRKKRLKELTLVVCSDGGDLSAGFALIDAMSSSRIPVATVGLGCIASTGLMIFMSGAKGKRTLTPNTSIMSHQYSCEVSGKSHELIALAKEFDATSARMLELYRRTTGQPDDVIKEKLLPAHDVYLSSTEALELNVCDRVANI